MTAMLPPLGLYVHIPWCERKCPYCDFNSHERPEALPESAYVDALLADLAQDAEAAGQRRLGSIFIGGGTPSLFSAEALARLLEGIEALLPFDPAIEITLEANPGSAERGKFGGYRAAGINRLSIGVQSFHAGHLQRLGRVHGPDDARQAIDAADAAGFDNINLDLMYGLPQQTPEQAMADLASAIAAGPAHISWYQLTIEPNTAFHRYPPPLPTEDNLIAIQDAGLARLEAAGYARYEVSAFARDERHAWHNLNYWRFGDYLGIGAGAHGKITTAGMADIVRTRKRRQPKHYLEAAGLYTAERHSISPEDRPLEFMLNALRLPEGFTREQFESRTGLSFEHVQKQVESLKDQRLLQERQERIQPSPRGMQFLNNILETFL